MSEVIDKEWIIRTGACHTCNLDFCDNDYDNCILIKKSKEQKKLEKWV